MQANFNVALSAQMSLQKRLETIANNVANASTAGFRAEEVKFETLLSQASSTPVAFASRRPELPFARIAASWCGPTTRSTWPSKAMPGSASRPPPAPSIRATAG